MRSSRLWRPGPIFNRRPSPRWRSNSRRLIVRVLGLSPLDKDSTVSFLEDGRVLFACGEERLSRVKLQSGFPDKALAMGFARTGWKPETVDAVAYAFFDWDEEARLIQEAVAEDARLGGSSTLRSAAARFTRAVQKEYHPDRTTRIPGLDTDESEFVPRKSWLKRTVYKNAASS